MTQLIVPFKAETIDDLYKKVCRGVYQPIDSSRYSVDLSKLISSMLNVDPAKRPSANQILLIPNVQERMKILGFSRVINLFSL